MDAKISESEWQVMEALWEAGSPMTAAEVSEKVSAERDWTLATVKTLLSRLLTKGALAADQDGRRFIYRPIIKRADYVGGESRRFVDRLFGGRLSPLVASLADEQALSDDDIKDLEALLKELKS